MFQCHACFKRFLRSLDALPDSPLALATTTSARRTLYTSSYQAERPSHRPNDSQSHEPGTKSVTTEDIPRKWPDSAEAQARRRGIAAAKHKPSGQQYQEKQLRRELEWLKDPLKLSDHIASLLDKDDYSKALALARLSNRGVENTVSWNHLIGYNMHNGKGKVAIDVFNEMKKRGQKPNAQTFTILLRGLADYTHHPYALGTALSLYHSMSLSNSKVMTSIIHTNALLKVCSRLLDLDSMWDIVSNLPESGPQAPNSWTFATILQTMREKVLTSLPGGEDAESAARRRDEMIIEARKLWAVIVTRWRSGDLVMDETLVCAMGRLLLIGSRPRDWDDVLSLVSQTMHIERLVPRLGTEARTQEGHPRIRAPNTPASMKNDSSAIAVQYDEARPGSEFDDAYAPKQTYSRQRRQNTSVYAKPKNNTLSLLLEACIKTAQWQSARAYWQKLTSPDGLYVVTPDMDNIHMLLRIFRANRASGDAAKILVEDIPELGLRYQSSTFRIAMSACARDILNSKVMDNANRILDLMTSRLKTSDLNVLLQYLEVAARSSEHLASTYTGHRNLDNPTSSEPRGDLAILMQAVKRLRGDAGRQNLIFDAVDTTFEALDLRIPRLSESAKRGTDASPVKSDHDQQKRDRAQEQILIKLMQATVGILDKIIEPVQEARAKLAKESASGVYRDPVYTVTESMQKGYVDLRKNLARRITEVKNRESAVKQQALQRAETALKEERRQIEEARKQAASERNNNDVPEDVEDGEPWKKKWTPGVRPRSGIAKSLRI